MAIFIAFLAAMLISTSCFGQGPSAGVQQFFGTWEGDVAVAMPGVSTSGIRFRLEKCGVGVCGTQLSPEQGPRFLVDFQDCSTESPPALCNGMVCASAGCIGDDMVGSEKRCIMKLVMEGASIKLTSSCLEGNQRIRKEWGIFTRR